jgi:hypothetical protein
MPRRPVFPDRVPVLLYSILATLFGLAVTALIVFAAEHARRLREREPDGFARLAVATRRLIPRLGRTGPLSDPAPSEQRAPRLDS